MTPRYALHTALPWEDHAGGHGEFMVRGWLEQLSPSHPAVTARPGQPPYGLVHYACSIEEAAATEYSDDELPVYRRWRSPSVPPAGPAEDLGRLGTHRGGGPAPPGRDGGQRSATPMLSALAELRAAVNAKP